MAWKRFCSVVCAVAEEQNATSNSAKRLRCMSGSFPGGFYFNPVHVIDSFERRGLACRPHTGDSMRKLAAIIALTFSLPVLAQAPAAKAIKMQSTWPASNTLQEHFKMFAERTEKLTQGGIKIEAMPAG